MVVGVGSETEKKAVKTQSSLSMEKKETVYIFADANGGCKKVVVTDRITNPEAQKNFKDIIIYVNGYTHIQYIIIACMFICSMPLLDYLEQF